MTGGRNLISFRMLKISMVTFALSIIPRETSEMTLEPFVVSTGLNANPPKGQYLNYNSDRNNHYNNYNTPLNLALSSWSPLMDFEYDYYEFPVVTGGGWYPPRPPPPNIKPVMIIMKPDKPKPSDKNKNKVSAWKDKWNKFIDKLKIKGGDGKDKEKEKIPAEASKKPSNQEIYGSGTKNKGQFALEQLPGWNAPPQRNPSPVGPSLISTPSQPTFGSWTTGQDYSTENEHEQIPIPSFLEVWLRPIFGRSDVKKKNQKSKVGK